MWGVLCKLPPDVVGTHIFSLLEWFDAVQLDSAVTLKDRRDLLQKMLQRVSKFEAPTSHCAPLNVTMWKWFWKRHVRLTGVTIAGEFLTKQYRAVKANAHQIVDGFRIEYKLSQNAEPIYDTLDRDESMCQLVSGLHVEFTLTGGRLFPYGQLRCLKQLTFAGPGNNLSKIHWIARTIEANPALELLHLDYPLRLGDYLSAMSTLRNLKTLRISAEGVTDAMFAALVQAHPQLENLNITVQVMSEEMYLAEEASWATLAQSCRRLRSVAVDGVDRLGLHHSPSLALLHLAQNCMDLQELGFPHEPMSDAILSALCCNCPHLHTLHCSWGKEVTLRGAESETKLWNQLCIWRIRDGGEMDFASFSVALKHATQLQKLALYLYGAQNVNAAQAALSCVSSVYLRELVLSYQDPSNTGESMMAPVINIVQRNPLLRRVELNERHMNANHAVLALAQHCPKLQELTLTGALDGIANEAVIMLAQGCSQLRILEGAFYSATTDPAIVALARNCPRLESSLDLHNSPLVTVSAVEQVIRRCRYLRDYITLPNTFPTGALTRLYEIAKTVRRPLGLDPLHIEQAT